MRKILNILYNLIVININENIFLQVTIMYILLTGSRYGHYIPFEWAGNLIFFLVNIIFESRTAWYSQIAISLQNFSITYDFAFLSKEPYSYILKKNFQCHKKRNTKNESFLLAFR